MNSPEPGKTTTNANVIIVGGGLAGLAAASALAPRGCSVTLLESRPRLGGRASSFLDRQTSEWIDNCQHVALGCCTNFLHFCRTVQIDQFLRTEPELYFIARDGVVNRLKESLLPAPLHLAPSFDRMSYLSVADRWSIARAIRKLCRWKPTTSPQSGTLLDWLTQQRQTPAALDRFWNVILTSALSESLDRIDIGHARKVIVDGFLSNRDGWRMLVPTLPLDDFYGKHLRAWLEQHQVEIRLQSAVDQIHLHNTRPTITLRNGQELSADHLILTLNPKLLSDMLPEDSPLRAQLLPATEMESSPITSLHLWFDREITPLPHAVLVDRLSQWIFSRDKLQNRSPNPQTGHYYQVVISASRNLRGIDRDQIIAQVVDELSQIWPQTREAKLLHSRLVTEHQAVFSPLPGIEAQRPPQQSAHPLLQFAGDWTNTGWPGTMEGAVRSGYLAAENILKRLGTPEPILQPDLPVRWLPRILLGLSR